MVVIHLYVVFRPCLQGDLMVGLPGQDRNLINFETAVGIDMPGNPH